MLRFEKIRLAARFISPSGEIVESPIEVRVNPITGLRSLNRNGYNLGLLIIGSETSRMELRAVLVARSNYAPWVRSDHTGFEVMLGEMATFVPPEQIAADARIFWKPDRKENV